MLNLLQTEFTETALSPSPVAKWLEGKSSRNNSEINLLLSSTSHVVAAMSDITSHAPLRPLIAVVDDEAVIAVTLSELLGRHGYRAVWFTSALRALEFVKAVPIDLLLTDLQMPELDGWNLSLQLATVRPKFPVLLLSGNTELLETLASTSSGSQQVCFAQKPIAVDQLIALIRQLVPTLLPRDSQAGEPLERGSSQLAE